jgi:hypothetical protein
MNANKAREYYSAYFEGTLEGGLKQSFERKLASDAVVQAEYRAYVDVVEKLNAMREDVIEVPHDLHETISAHLDKHLWEKQRKTRFALGGWWRSLALGGLATLAIVGTIASLNGGMGAIGAGIVGVGSKDSIDVVATNEGVFIEGKVVGHSEVEVRDLLGGKLLKTIKLDGQRIHAPITNTGTDPIILSFSRVGDSRQIRVAIPGARSASEPQGSGMVADLAKAAAGYYHVPIRIETDDLDSTVRWKFAGRSMSEADSSDFGQTKLTFEQRGEMLALLKR